MTKPASVTQLVDEIAGQLIGSAFPIVDAPGHVPDAAGLYAIHAEPDVWRQLELDERITKIPLYVGKSESSLVTRELKTHFAIAPGAAIKTGGSTVRRTFAALLRSTLDLHPRPRDAAMNPKYAAHFSLDPESDQRLTAWMHEHLAIAVWPKPATLQTPLVQLERAVLARWDPPLNIQDVTPRPQLRAARAAMARDAQSWGAEAASRG